MGNTKSNDADNRAESQKPKTISSKPSMKSLFRSGSMKSGERTKRENEIKAIFNNFAKQVTNEEIVKEFISKLSDKDAKEISRGEQTLSTNLYDYLVKHINTDKYIRFIDYVNEKQSSMLEDIPVSDNSFNVSQGMQSHYGDTTVPKDSSKSEKSGAVSQSGTMHKDDTMCKDRTCENMTGDGPTKEGLPEYKYVDAMKEDLENEEPPAPLDVSNEDKNKKNGDEYGIKQNPSDENTTKAGFETGQQSISNENYLKLSPLTPIEEENYDHNNSQPINEPESHLDKPNLLITSTESSSPTSSSLQSCYIKERENNIKALFNKYAEQLNNEEFVKEFNSTLFDEDADMVLHGGSTRSKDLFDFLIRHISTEMYVKFINYMSEKKSSILEVIPYIDANINDDNDIQHHCKEETAPDKMRECEGSVAVSESVIEEDDVIMYDDGLCDTMMEDASPKQGLTEYADEMEVDEDIEETLEFSKKDNGIKESGEDRRKDFYDVESTMEVDFETEQQLTSIVNESKPDILSRNYMLIAENVDTKKVCPYVEKHFISEPHSIDMEMKELLKFVIQDPESPLYEDFRKALQHTYPNFYDRIYNCAVPTCSTSAVKTLKGENDNGNNSECLNKAEINSQSLNISKISTESSSCTASSLKSGDISKRENKIETLFHEFSIELSDDKFVMGFISKISAEDANMVLNGKSPPSTELFYFLKRHITTNIYNRFINYLNHMKPNILKDISITDPSLNDEDSSITDPSLNNSRGRKRQCDDANMSVNGRECEDRFAVPDSGTIFCDGTATINENDIASEHRAYPNTMEGSSLKQLCQEHKCDEPILPDVESVEPHVQLDFTKEDSRTHVIQRVQEQVKGSIVSFALREHNVPYEDAFHLGQLLVQHNGLEHFSIENNFMGIESISTLIGSITDMHRLNSISLCGQSLVPSCLEYLRESLQNNTVLQELTLDNSRIDSEGLSIISSVLNKDSLKMLSLNDNGFGDASLGNLMDSLNNAKNLCSLSLDRNGISDSGCLIVGQRLVQFDTAFTLSLGDNQISDNGAVKLANIFKQRSKTCTLNLASNQIGNDGAEHLVNVWLKKGFSGMLKLEGNHISRKVETKNAPILLSENRTSREIAENIAKRIRNGEAFNAIALNGISLEEKSMEIITTAIYFDLKQRSGSAITDGCPDIASEDEEMWDGEKLSKVVYGRPFCGIVHLNISNNALTSKAMGQLAELIRVDHLLTLDIGGNDFISTDFYTLSEALNGNKSLNVLHLQKSKVNDDGASYISMAMKNCESLQYLNLDGNEITGSGSVHISNALVENKSLKRLDISDNLIGEDSSKQPGIRHLASVLKTNTKLLCLNLRGNRVRDNGLKKLSNALPQSSLQSLDVSNNEIGPDGATACFSSTMSSKLTELDVSDNPIGDKSTPIIRMHLKRLPSKLKVLCVRNTKFTDEAARHLMKGMKPQNFIDMSSNKISNGLKQELKQNYGDKVLCDNEEKSMFDLHMPTLMQMHPIS